MSDDHDKSMQAALALLELGDDEAVLAAAALLQEWVRPVDTGVKETQALRVFRGLVPARKGIAAVLSAAAPNDARPVLGFARLVAALEARKDVDALARPRAVREPVVAILYELYKDEDAGDQRERGWEPAHRRCWALLQCAITSWLVDERTRTAPDDPSSGHLKRYAFLIHVWREEWPAIAPDKLRDCLPDRPTDGPRQVQKEAAFIRLANAVSKARLARQKDSLGKQTVGRERPVRHQGLLAQANPTELHRLDFLVFGRADDKKAGDGPPNTPEEIEEAKGRAEARPLPDEARRQGQLPPPRGEQPGEAGPITAEEGQTGVATPVATEAAPPADEISVSVTSPGDNADCDATVVTDDEALYRRVPVDEPTPFIMPETPRQEHERAEREEGGPTHGQIPAEDARCDDLPRLGDQRALPDDGLPYLGEALLPPGQFAAASLTDQACALVLLLSHALYISPRRLAPMQLVSGLPEAGASDVCFDEGTGVLWIRPEERYVRQLAAAPSHPEHEAVAGEYWPIRLQRGLEGLLRVHLVAARTRRRPGSTSRSALWVGDGMTALRPLAHTDYVDRLVGLSRGRSMPIRPDHPLRLAEAQCWQDDSTVCPGMLIGLAGTYTPRLRIVATYQALTGPARSAAHARMPELLLAELESRPCAWAGRGHWGRQVADRLRALLAEGAAAAPETAPPGPAIRSGTPRHLRLRYIARIYARAWREAWPLDRATPAALATLLCVCLRVLLGLRRTELRLLRLVDVVGLATDTPGLIVHGKPAGDGRIRPLEIPLVGVLERVLRAYLRAAPPRADGKLLAPALLDAVLADLPHGVRHALASYLTERCADPGLFAGLAMPRGWLIIQAIMGHEIAGLPVGRDDETTWSTIRRAVGSFVLAYHGALIDLAGADDDAAPPPRRVALAHDEPRPLLPPVTARAVAFLEAVAPADLARPGGVAHFLTHRLDATDWPTHESARQRRLSGWYADAIIVEGDRRGRESRRLLALLAEVLIGRGELLAPPDPNPRGVRALTGLTLDLVGLADHTGARLRRTLREELAGPCTAGDAAARALLPLVAGLLLLLDCAWPDALAAISAARRSDVRPRERVLRCPSAFAVDADDPARDRAIVLGADTELALHVLCRQGGHEDGLLLQPPGEATCTPARIADRLRRAWSARTGTRPRARTLRAVAWRHNQEHHGGATVAFGVGGELHRPIHAFDTSVLATYEAAGFHPTTSREMAPLPDCRPRIAGRVSVEDGLTELAAGVRTAIRERHGARQALAEELRTRARALLMVHASEDSQDPDPERLAMALAATEDGEAALAANTALALHFLAGRIDEGRLGRDGRAREHGPGLAWGTLDAYWDDLVVALRHIGTTPLHRWGREQWAILEGRDKASSTMRRLQGTLRQWHEAALACGIPVAAQWQLAVTPVAAPLALPSSGQLLGLARRLRRDGGEFARSLILLFGMQARHGLRLHEAMALLGRDIRETMCWVDAAHTKDKTGRAVAAMPTFDGFEAFLHKQVGIRAATRQLGEPEPPLLPNVIDPARAAALERRYRAILAGANVWPHLLRHRYLTLVQSANHAVRDAPDREWAPLAVAIARAPDAAREAAANAGHITIDYTCGVYDQGIEWRLRRIAEHRQRELEAFPMSQVALLRLLHIGMGRLANARHAMPALGTGAATYNLSFAVDLARALAIGDGSKP